MSLNNLLQFIPTLLSNTSYTNVTGGQRVGVRSSSSLLSRLYPHYCCKVPNYAYSGISVLISDMELRTSNSPENLSILSIAFSRNHFMYSIQSLKQDLMIPLHYWPMAISSASKLLVSLAQSVDGV
jgi:hypothetical protein